MAPHSSTLAWKIPWAEEPGRLQVHGIVKSQTQLSDFIFTFHFHALEKAMATHSSVFAWRIPGTLLSIIKDYVVRWRRQWHPTPVLLPGKSHGQRSLVGCSPWGRYKSDTTEQLPFHLSLSCIGEVNGNPLRCSCLENPRDGGAWWAAVYGVTLSRTQLK